MLTNVAAVLPEPAIMPPWPRSARGGSNCAIIMDRLVEVMMSLGAAGRQLCSALIKINWILEVVSAVMDR